MNCHFATVCTCRTLRFFCNDTLLCGYPSHKYYQVALSSAYLPKFFARPSVPQVCPSVPAPCLSTTVARKSVPPACPLVFNGNPSVSYACQPAPSACLSVPAAQKSASVANFPVPHVHSSLFAANLPASDARPSVPTVSRKVDCLPSIQYNPALLAQPRRPAQFIFCTPQHGACLFPSSCKSTGSHFCTSHSWGEAILAKIDQPPTNPTSPAAISCTIPNFLIPFPQKQHTRNLYIDKSQKEQYMIEEVRPQIESLQKAVNSVWGHL